LLAAYGDGQQDAPRLDEPSSIAVDLTGCVYVANRGSRSVLVLDKDFRPLMAFPADGGKVLDSPSGIAVSGPGQVFITDQGLNKIVVFK
jgi:DNA-binding beta-propeller fold protein YncE